MGEKRQKENSGKAETACKNSPGKKQVCAEKDRTAGGVITVFLSLILPVVLTVFATCLESARFEGLRLRGQLAADAAVQSVFAGYDRPLYERYGLLFVCTADPPQRELEEIAKTYGIRNTQAEEGRNGLLSLKLIETEASALRGAETEGGRVFLQAVGAYMQESGRMEAARIAAAEAGAGGYGQTKIALVEYLMREFSALTDEGAAGCQLEYCAAGTAGRAACLQEVQRRIYEDRYARYLEYFRERQRTDPGEGQRELEEDGPDHGEEMGGPAEGPGHGDWGGLFRRGPRKRRTFVRRDGTAPAGTASGGSGPRGCHPGRGRAFKRRRGGGACRRQRPTAHLSAVSAAVAVSSGCGRAAAAGNGSDPGRSSVCGTGL